MMTLNYQPTTLQYHEYLHPSVYTSIDKASQHPGNACCHQDQATCSQRATGLERLNILQDKFRYRMSRRQVSVSNVSNLRNKNAECVLLPSFASSSSRPSGCWLLGHRQREYRKLFALRAQAVLQLHRWLMRHASFRLTCPRLPPERVPFSRFSLKARTITATRARLLSRTLLLTSSGSNASSCNGSTLWTPSFASCSPPRLRKGEPAVGDVPSRTGVLRGLPTPVERRPLAPPLLVGDSGDPGDKARTEDRLCLTGRRRRLFLMWLASGVRGCRGDWIGSVGCCSCMVHATRRIGNWNSLLFSGRSPACNSTLAFANRNECLTMGYESGCAS